MRWHRCLRCDSWLPVAAAGAPAARAPAATRRDRAAAAGQAAARQDRPAADRDQPRGALRRARRARGVVFVFASHRDDLRRQAFRVIADLQTGSGDRPAAGPRPRSTRSSALLAAVEHAARWSARSLAVYALVEGVEAIGLWYQRRWAEYLTFLVTDLAAAARDLRADAAPVAVQAPDASSSTSRWSPTCCSPSACSACAGAARPTSASASATSAGRRSSAQRRRPLEIARKSHPDRSCGRCASPRSR